MRERDIVRHLIHRHQTRDPFELASLTDREIVIQPLVGVRGFYQYFMRNHIIYLDEALDDVSRKFVCAHELAHSFMHRDVNAIYLDSRTFFTTRKYEIQADRFAADLLISDADVEEYVTWPVDKLSQMWGIRGDAIKYRLQHTQIGFGIKEDTVQEAEYAQPKLKSI